MSACPALVGYTTFRRFKNYGHNNRNLSFLMVAFLGSESFSASTSARFFASRSMVQPIPSDSCYGAFFFFCWLLAVWLLIVLIWIHWCLPCWHHHHFSAVHCFQFSKEIWSKTYHVSWHMVSKWTTWSFNIQPLRLWYSFVREGSLNTSNQALHCWYLSWCHCTLCIHEQNLEFLLISRVNSIFSPVALLKSFQVWQHSNQSKWVHKKIPAARTLDWTIGPVPLSGWTCDWTLVKFIWVQVQT